ncbi:MAG: hypothetical protein ABI461_10805 [Polyangiaceae bacterium]
MKTIALLSLFAVSLVTGCSINSSSNSAPADDSLHSAGIATNQIKVALSAQSGDQNVKVYASLHAYAANGDSKHVTLDQGDVLTASVAGLDAFVLTLQPDNGGDVTYTATLPVAMAAEDVTIAFVRGAGKTSAPNSIVHVPLPFTMTTDTTSLKYGSPVSVKVTPAPTTATTFEVSGPCLASDGNDSLTAPTLDANGVGTINTQQIKLSSTSSSCSVGLFLSTYDDDGKIDSAFAGGFIGLGDTEGQQKRGLIVTMNP